MSQIDPREQRTFALQIVERLRGEGHEALWAGGCVRDELLGRVPKDYDVATTATPDQIQTLFGPRRTLMIGAAFGVAAVVGHRHEGTVEVATFRQDAEYADGRHPDHVTFSTAEHDAQRRDFTINGLFFDPVAGRVIDYVGGQADLAAHLVRAIGNPHERFTEDKLRMLRAVRMAATFDFTIDAATEVALRAMAGEITVVSPERIAQELRLLFMLPAAARGINLLRTTGLLRAILPELESFAADAARWSQVLAVAGCLRRTSFPLVLAVLISEADAVPPLAEQASTVGRRLKLSNHEHDRAGWLVAHRDALADAHRRPWSQVQPVLIAEGAAELVNWHEARSRVAGAATDAADFCRRRLDAPPGELNPPALVTGNDLIAHGLAPGKQFAELLEAVRAAQLDGQVRSKDEALALVDQRLRGGVV